MKIELNVILPNGFSYVWTYQGVTLSMGRDQTCDMEVDDTAPRSVSRRHARMECGENGMLLVRDFQSKNGTYLNGERISGVAPLRLGDEIRLGRKGPRLIVLKFAPDGTARRAVGPPPLPTPKPKVQDAVPAAVEHRMRFDLGQWMVAMAGMSAVLALAMLVSMLWLSSRPSAPTPRDCPDFRVSENGTVPFRAGLPTEKPVHVDVVLTYRGSNPGGRDRADQ